MTGTAQPNLGSAAQRATQSNLDRAEPGRPEATVEEQVGLAQGPGNYTATAHRVGVTRKGDCPTYWVHPCKVWPPQPPLLLLVLRIQSPPPLVLYILGLYIESRRPWAPEATG